METTTTKAPYTLERAGSYKTITSAKLREGILNGRQIAEALEAAGEYERADEIRSDCAHANEILLRRYAKNPK